MKLSRDSDGLKVDIANCHDDPITAFEQHRVSRYFGGSACNICSRVINGEDFDARGINAKLLEIGLGIISAATGIPTREFVGGQNLNCG